MDPALGVLRLALAVYPRGDLGFPVRGIAAGSSGRQRLLKEGELGGAPLCVGRVLPGLHGLAELLRCPECRERVDLGELLFACRGAHEQRPT